MPAEIILDVSRLLSRVLHATPTGVDRVEMAYARGLIAAAPQQLRFAAVHPCGLYGRLLREPVLRFLDATEQCWTSEGGAPRRWPALRVLVQLRPRAVPPVMAAAPPVYVQVSPHHLTRPALVERILRREQARLLCMVHDLIPLDYPEYARPHGAARHRLRIETITRHADAIVANSAATLESLRPWIARSGRTPLARVAHLGIWQAPAQHAAVLEARPYFVCIATIEPRKNHLLLLHVWRRLAERYGADVIPKLVLVGRRGWENEQVVDMLERCPALKGCVEEHRGMPDRQVQGLLQGARALLLPSFAEGYGMPVAEALHAGVPVICSDLPALREVGGTVPDYLDSLDGPGWTAAILDYSDPTSRRRASQIAAMKEWVPTGWSSHIKVVLGMISELAA